MDLDEGMFVAWRHPSYRGAPRFGQVIARHDSGVCEVRWFDDGDVMRLHSASVVARFIVPLCEPSGMPLVLPSGDPYDED